MNSPSGTDGRKTERMTAPSTACLVSAILGAGFLTGAAAFLVVSAFGGNVAIILLVAGLASGVLALVLSVRDIRLLRAAAQWRADDTAECRDCRGV